MGGEGAKFNLGPQEQEAEANISKGAVGEEVAA